MQHQQYHRFPLQYQRHAQPIIPSQGPEDVASHAQMHRSGNNDEVDQIPFLAGETGPIQHPPHSPTSRTAGPLPGLPSGGIASEGSTFQAVDDGEKSGSYGTLMLSKGGRSKYLGPTAAIEWLKDVCRLGLIMLNELNYSSRKRKMYQKLQYLLVRHRRKFLTLRIISSPIVSIPAPPPSPFLSTARPLGLVLGICFRTSLQERRRGYWSSLTIAIVPGSECYR